MEKNRNKLDDTEHWEGMEFENGKVQSYFPLPTNKIISKSQHSDYLFFGIFFTSITNFSSLTLIATIITILVMPQSSPFGLISYMVLLIVLLLINIMKEIYFDRARSKADQKINQRKVKVYRGKESMQLEWQDLRQGDIVYLVQGQIVPADIILLDSQQIQHRQAVSYVDIRNVNGQITPQKKVACYLTQMVTRGAMQKLNWQNYQKVITGKLNFEKQTQDLQKFTGYLKLTKDPKVQKLSMDNLILRQSILKTSLWVYGLVVYTGMNTKIMKNRNSSANIKGWFNNKFDIVFACCLLVNVILGALFSFLYLYRSEDRPILSMISYHFQMFSVFLPHPLYICHGFILLCSAYFDKKQDGLQIRNYEHLHKLGQLDIAILADYGVINSGQLIVDEIVTPSAVYNIKTKDTLKGKKKKTFVRRNGSNHEREQVSEVVKKGSRRNQFSNINNQFFFQNNTKNKISVQDERFEIQDNSDVRMKISPLGGSSAQLPNRLKPHQLPPLKINKVGLLNEVNKGGEQAIQIIKSFVLCHQAKFFYNSQEESYDCTSSINAEQVLLKLAKDVGWEISPKMDLIKEVGLFVKEFSWMNMGKPSEISQQAKKSRSYEWVGINNFRIARKLFSVVVKDEKKVILYCKGRPQDIMERIVVNKQTQKTIDSTLLAYKNKKAETIIYAKKELTKQQMQYYETQYTNLKYSLTTTEDEIREFSKKWQSDLQFLSIVSLSSQINEQSRRLVSNLTQSGIKVCMISNNDLQVDTFKDILQPATIQQTEKMEYISFDKQTSELTRYYLNQVTRKINSTSKYSFGLILNGKTWELLTENSDIMQHFLFIMYYSEGVIAYNFTPKQTAQLTIKLKHSYPIEQTTMAIGSSYGDLKFQDQSDLSISVGSQLPADINAQTLEDVIKIISRGPSFLETYYSVLTLILYRVVTLGTVTLVFEIFLISHNSSYTLEGFLLFLLGVILIFVEIGYNMYFNHQENSPSFNCEKTQKQKLAYYSNFKRINRKVFLSALQGFVHGTVIMCVVILTLPQVRLSGGRLLPAGALHMATFTLILFVNHMKYLFKPTINKLNFLVITLITMLIMALGLFIFAMTDRHKKGTVWQFFTLFSNYDSATLIVNTVLFCLAISFFIQEIVKKYFYPTTFREEYTSESENKQILKDLKINNKDIEKVELVKHLFKEEENIENSISEFVSDEQVDLNSLKINKMVEIRNQQGNIKNLYENHKRNSHNFFRTLTICFVIQVVLLIVNVGILQKQFGPALIPFVFGLVLTVPICFYIKYGQVQMNYYPFAEASIISLCIIFCLYAIFDRDQSIFLLFCLLSLITTQLMQIRMFVLCIISACLIISNTVLLLVSNNSPGQIVFEIFFTLICIIVNLIVLRNSLIESKINFIKNQTFEKQTHYVNDILSILVPKFVKQHLENYTENFALQQKQNKVSVLFCYVCNFEQVVKQQGKNVVLIMDELFRQFDQLCHNFAVQKIETVGFTYMAATGIKVIEDEMQNQFTKKNQVQRLLKMGIQMLDKAKSVSWGLKKDKRLDIKVGIHHGDVVIGVIGYHKPQFSLIGDTVNTTSRHCSTGNFGDITLSSIAYQMLKRFSHTSFTKKQKEMKGLGTVNVYVYNKSEDLKSNHMIIKMRFRECVNKVIEQLKAQGKINYRRFKAQDLAKKMAQQVEMNIGRKNTRRSTNNQRRSSVNRVQQFMEVIEKQKEENIQGKFNKDKLMPHNWLLELQERNNQYHSYVKKKNSQKDRLLLGVILPLILVNIIYNSASGYWSTGSIIVRCFSFVFYGLVVYYYHKVFKTDHYLWIFTLGLAYVILIQKLTTVFGLQEGTLYDFNSYSYLHFKEYFPMILLTVASASQGFRFVHILVLCIFSTVLSIIDMSIHQQQRFQLAIIYEIFYYSLILFRKYLTLRDSYNNFIQMINYQKRNKEQQDLVSQLLPKHAYEKLKNQNIQNRLELTDQFQNCTMLYADIKGFTSFSKKHENQPDVIVEMLRKLFEQFDKKCLEHNVYKVYTIGDCYVVLGFTNCYKRDILQEAKNVVNMGLGMVEHIQTVRQKFSFDELDMRIGIHTGTVIGGIIGTQIVRYDIYGPHVMIANKFEEKGETGHIHISQATKEILDQDKKSPYNIVAHGKVKIEKLNAEYNSYLLSKKKFQL